MAYQAIITLIITIATSFDSTDGDFSTFAISQTMTGFAFSKLACQAIRALMITFTTMIQIGFGIINDSITCGVSDTNSIDTFQTIVTGMVTAATIRLIMICIHTNQIVGITAKNVSVRMFRIREQLKNIKD